MNPDISLRLKSIEKALTDVIARALPAHEQLARDQLNLIVGHLRIIDEHWRYALRYELGTLDQLLTLAAQLRPFGDAALQSRLDEACQSAGAVDRTDFDQVSAAQRALAAALDRMIAADDSTAPIPPGLRDAVLAHFARAAPRERAWHHASNLDPDPDSLPPVSSLFTPST